MLGGDLADLDGTNAELAERRLSTDKLSRGVKFLKIASALQYTVYGIPSLYYGDEVGLEGAHDPFCRMPFPWGELDKPYRSEILEHYRRLGRIRQEHKALHDGRFYVVRHTESSLVFVREREDDRVLIAVNRGDMFDMPLPEGKIYRELLTDTEYRGSVRIEKDRAMIFKEC